MSQAGIVDIEGTHPQIPTSFVTNDGTAVPLLNVLELLGTVVAAHNIPLQTVGSGNTVTIQAQYTSAAATSISTNAGLASFNSMQFSVDANGYVTLNGSVVAETITGNSGPALSPVLGNWNIYGSAVAAGTTPVHTVGSGNTLTVDVQTAQAIASTNVTNIGLAAFNSAYFTVDGNGFVSLKGTAVGETITGTTGGALSPVGGNWNILASSTAAGSTPIQTAGTGNTLTIQVQKAQAIASTNASNVGLAAFNSSQFSVDANGYVSYIGNAGTVTSVSVVSANGFAGTVANATTTPAITLTTTVTGVLSGNGTAISGSSITQYAVLVGGVSNAIVSIPDVAVGSVFVSGGTAANPAFSAYPQVSGLGIGASPGSTAGLTFDGTNFMDAYSTGTWTPTFYGATTAGTTTYISQTGYYTRIGNLVTCYCLIQFSTATGTGNVLLDGLPFTIGNHPANYVTGSIYWGPSTTWTFPAGATALSILGNPNTTTSNIYAYGTGIATGYLQMQNQTLTMGYTISYLV